MPISIAPLFILVASSLLILPSRPSSMGGCTSPSLREKKCSGDGCFVCQAGCPVDLRQQRTEPPSTKMQSSSVSESAKSSSIYDAGDGEFNLQKARLLARFSSVAYEDPPSDARRGMAGVEQFTDDYGVTITRPILKARETENERSMVQSDENLLNMAHSEATSPRPLALMLSGCNTSGITENDDFNSLSAYRFQWLALATNDNTSTQFDAWRITSAYDNILVIAFRGTRLSSYLELYTDIQLKQDMISGFDFGVGMGDGGEDIQVKNAKEVMADPMKKGSQLSLAPIGSTLMAHSGFLKAYSSIRSTLLQMLSDNTGAYDQIWFTGHSLGASLATLAVVDMGSLMDDGANPGPRFDLPRLHLSSYLFGTPRVGNREFADRLEQLQHRPDPIIQEYFRVNNPGDAVPFLPRGRVANRLDIDYVHAGASVFLPALCPDNAAGNDDGDTGEILSDGLLDGERKNQSYSQWMMQLEADAIEQINALIFQSDGSTAADTSTGGALQQHLGDISTKVRIYPKGDQPPDPLSEIDPDYSGFLPFDPRTWISSKSFQKFLLGEAIRSFRILRGGFVKNHRLKTYKDGLCLASQENMVIINRLKSSSM